MPRDWFDYLLGRPSCPTGRRSRPRLEALEVRALLSGDLLWASQFGDPPPNLTTSTLTMPWAVAADRAGNTLVAGTAETYVPGQTGTREGEIFLRMLDAAGQVVWSRRLGPTTALFVTAVASDRCGNFYVAGVTHGTLPGQTSAGGSDAFVHKVDAAGRELWTRQFGTGAYDGASGVAVDDDGNLYVAGATNGTLPGQTAAGDRDGFLRKYDAAGNELWTRQFGTAGYDFGGCVAVDGLGNVAVACDAYVEGVTHEPPILIAAGVRAPAVRKFDAAGNALWSVQFGAEGWFEVTDVAADAGGNVYVAGRANASLLGLTNPYRSNVAYVRKFEADGAGAWAREFYANVEVDEWGYPVTADGSYFLATDEAVSVAVDGGGNVTVVGDTTGTLPGQTLAGLRDVFVRQYDPDGTERWTRQLGTSGYEFAAGVAADGAGNLYFAGFTSGTLPGETKTGDADGFVLKFGDPNAPASLHLSGASVAENAPAGSAVGTLAAGAGGPLTYSLVACGCADAPFEVVGDELRTKQAFDYEANASYTVRLRATDADGRFTEKDFTVAVTDVNEAPTGLSLSSGAVAENQPAGTTVGLLRAADPDGGDRHAYALVSGSGDADNAAFEIVGDQLRTRQSFDHEAKASYTVRVRANDGEGRFTEQTFAVSVVNVNEAPVNAVPSTRTMYRNGSLAVALVLRDADAGDRPLVVTVKAATGRLYVASYSGLTSATGYGTATLTLTGPLTALNAALARLTYRPNRGFVGYARLYLTSNDGALSDTDSFLVRVVNRKPVRTRVIAYTTRVNRALYVSASAGLLRSFRDYDGDRLSVQLVRRPAVGTLRLSTSGGFSYVPPRNFKGKVTFVVRAFDGNRYSDFATVTLTVF